jgi:hypothetical protein
MFGTRAGAQRRERSIDVWLNPAAGASATGLAHEIAADVHLVVVPKTGSRQADVAVLRDPAPVELARVARLLPGTRLIVATTDAPPRALANVARQVGARLLTAPSPAALLREIGVRSEEQDGRSLLASA